MTPELKTIKVRQETKRALDTMKRHPQETYDYLLQRMIHDLSRDD